MVMQPLRSQSPTQTSSGTEVAVGLGDGVVVPVGDGVAVGTSMTVAVWVDGALVGVGVGVKSDGSTQTPLPSSQTPRCMKVLPGRRRHIELNTGTPQT